jgi:hypothetical protein
MTTPPPLSPDAQAVLEAQAKARCLGFWGSVNDPPCHPSDSGWNGCSVCVDRAGVAAAIREAVDRVIPESEPPQRNDFTARSVFQWAVDCHHADEATRAKLLAIAAELDGGNNTTSQETNR